MLPAKRGACKYFPHLPPASSLPGHRTNSDHYQDAVVLCTEHKGMNPKEELLQNPEHCEGEVHTVEGAEAEHTCTNAIHVTMSGVEESEKAKDTEDEEGEEENEVSASNILVMKMKTQEENR